MSRDPALAESASEYARLEEDATQADIRYRANRARSEDEYLDVVREAGSLRAGLRVMGAGRAAPAPVPLPIVSPFDPTKLTTSQLENYERVPHDPDQRAGYLADPIVRAALAELARRQKEKTP